MEDKLYSGNFISLEGVDGSGKSTLIASLENYFQEDENVVFTREPGGTELGEKVRGLLKTKSADFLQETELLLFNAARYEHVEKFIKPNLRAGKKVICDRFYDSTIAYQSVALGIEKAFVEQLHQLLFSDFMPDLTLILDLDLDSAKARVNNREDSVDRYDAFSDADFNKVREAYQEIAKNNPKRCKLINAAVSKEQLLKDVLAILGK
jgi:dTMP kinase